MHAHAADEHKSDDQHGAGQEENLDLFGHQTKPIPLKTKNTCQGELPNYYSQFFRCSLEFLGNRKSVRAWTCGFCLWIYRRALRIPRISLKPWRTCFNSARLVGGTAKGKGDC